MGQIERLIQNYDTRVSLPVGDEPGGAAARLVRRLQQGRGAAAAQAAGRV